MIVPSCCSVTGLAWLPIRTQMKTPPPQTLRDKKIVECDCPKQIKDPYKFRLKLVCPRSDPESSYDNPACRDGTCDTCKDLRLLIGADGKGGILMCEACNWSLPLSAKRP